MTDGTKGAFSSIGDADATSTDAPKVTPKAEGAGKPMTFSDLEDESGGFDSDPDAAFESNSSTKPNKEKKEDASSDDDDLDLDLDDEDGSLDDPSEDDDLDEGLDGDEDSNSEEGETKEGEEGEEAEDKSIHKVKVNGKWREYSTKQMKDMVASGAHLVEQRQSFESEKVAFHNDFRDNMAKLSEANSIVTPIYQALKEGNIEKAIIETASFKNMSKLDMRRKLINQMLPVVAQRLGLTQQEVSTRLSQMKQHNDYLDNQEEVTFLREKQESPKKSADEDADAEAERAVQKYQVENGVSDHELRNTIQWLRENTFKGRQDGITLNVVQRTIESSRIVDKAFTAIEAVRPSLKSNSKFVDRVIAAVKQKPDWTVGKIARWVEKQARNSPATTQSDSSEVKELQKSVSRKVLKQGSKSALTKTSQGSQKKPMSFRDLDDDEGMFV